MKKYLMIGAASVVATVMLLGDGYAVYSMTKAAPARAADVDAAAAQKATKPVPLSKRVFVKLNKFVVTIPGSASGSFGPAYLQVSMTFGANDAKAAKDFSKVKSIIKSEIIGTVMQSGRELHEHPNKERVDLAMQAVTIANRVVSQEDPKAGKAPFFGGYITSFMIQ